MQIKLLEIQSREWSQQERENLPVAPRKSFDENLVQVNVANY